MASKECGPDELFSLNMKPEQAIIDTLVGAGVQDEYSEPADRLTICQTHVQRENVGYWRPMGILITHPVRLRDAISSRVWPI